jgi:protein-L-isoaspartate(D-aspartate) O-methyltransferase
MLSIAEYPVAVEPRIDILSEKIRLIMQLRRNGISDTRVLGAIEAIPREHFVPDAFYERAYEDTALPIEVGQTISQPTIVAWMTWALEINDRQCVLEIGTGSGYQAAILSKLCRRVYSIERHDNLLRIAQQRFHRLGLNNITTQLGDGSKGWKAAAPFDRIIVTAAATEVPKILLEQLSIGGVMVIPVGSGTSDQILLRIIRTESGYETQHLMPVRFVPLVSSR